MTWLIYVSVYQYAYERESNRFFFLQFTRFNLMPTKCRPPHYRTILRHIIDIKVKNIIIKKRLFKFQYSA